MCILLSHEQGVPPAATRGALVAICLLLVGLIDGTARANTGSRLTAAQAQQVDVIGGYRPGPDNAMGVVMLLHNC